MTKGPIKSIMLYAPPKILKKEVILVAKTRKSGNELLEAFKVRTAFVWLVALPATLLGDAWFPVWIAGVIFVALGIIIYIDIDIDTDVDKQVLILHRKAVVSLGSLYCIGMIFAFGIRAIVPALVAVALVGMATAFEAKLSEFAISILDAKDTTVEIDKDLRNN